MPFTPLPTAPPSATSIGGLRSSHTNLAGRIGLVGCSAQRHKGGGRRPGDSREAERPASLILPIR